MRLTFQVRFHTTPGQSLLLVGNHPLFGHDDLERAVPLQYVNEQLWQAALSCPPGTAPDVPIAYSYVLRQADGSLTQDEGRDRVINLAEFKSDEVLLLDSWNHPGFHENAFYTEPFQEVLLKGGQVTIPSAALGIATHTFRVKTPLLGKGQTLCLVGDAPSLGNWNTGVPVLLNRQAGSSFFTAEVDLSRAWFPVSYKYGVYDVERSAFLRYEDGPNRVLHDSVARNKHTFVNDGFAVLPAPNWKGAGVAIPVFSLKSKSSFGVGEFTDLKLLADWCRQTGLKVIQLLPVNDTTASHAWTDSYPYAAVSAFALHPLYLNLEQVANAANKARLPALESERQRLNRLETIDYEAVMSAKLAFLKAIYPSQKTETLRSPQYQQFFDENKHWLAPYAIFCFLRDKYGTARFDQWPAHRRFNAVEIAALAASGSELSDELGFHCFLQYHLHRQLQEASRYAHERGIILKGDIAIGVNRFGADAWQQPELYHMDMQAGAPPDAFAAKGQNWSFPTYNWPRMKQDGFAWWKQRFEQMGHYFDAFRIDHILGFFRIWSIPMHAVEGILGYFVPALPVPAAEFTRRGIWFDHARYVKPFITDAILAELFGPSAELVKQRFLVMTGPGQYSLKPEFATQRQVESYFAALEPTEADPKLKEGLFDLISNVILLEPEGVRGQQFHFRLAMDKTSSFRLLPAQTQAQLKDLYADYFFHRQDAFWLKEAMEKLPALKRATNMLVCGEDLGMVPACVPDALKQLGLLTLEVQRMPKDQHWEFGQLRSAPYLSVVTPSTHDMSTIRGWWEEDREVTERFFNRELGRPGVAPETCPPEINQIIVLQHLASTAMWSIFQLQDLLGMDERLRRANPAEERINIPANPKHYWRYRMHLTLEQLLGEREFNLRLSGMVRQNGR